MSTKEKIANTFVSAILNSNGATERNRTVIICMASIGTNRCTTAAFFKCKIIIPNFNNNASDFFKN